MREASETGLPPLRPLVLHHPEDDTALREDHSFLFGPHLLIAPIVRAGAARRHVYLPEGRWVEFFNLARGGATTDGPTDTVAHADLRTVPAYLRAGGAVALTEPAAHTTTANWATLTWHVHAAPRIEGVLYEDDGDGYGPSRLTALSGELAGDVLTLRRAVEGELPLAREAETLVVYGLSGASTVEGAQEWAFENGVLTVTVGCEWRELSVRG